MQRGMVDEERGPGMDGRDRKYKCKRPVYKIAWDAVRLESGGGGGSRQLVWLLAEGATRVEMVRSR